MQNPQSLRAYAAPRRASNHALSSGFYLIRQPSSFGVVYHYGILDVGNRLQRDDAGQAPPVVIHQIPPAISIDPLEHTGAWELLFKVPDDVEARARMQVAFTNPNYNLLGNNCEQFARYVATGTFESKQLQVATLIAAVGLLCATCNDE
jgi:hypothetical protein